MRLPAAARCYLWALVLAAPGFLAWWAWAWRGPVAPNGGLMALLVVLAVLAQHFPLPLGPRHKLDTSIAIYFACLLLFSVPVAMALVGVGQLLGGATLIPRRNPATGKRLGTVRATLFNAAQHVIATGLGGLAYYATLPHRAPAPLDRAAALWAVPLAALAMYLANSGAVAVMIGLQQRQSPVAIWLAGQRLRWPQSAALFLLGLLTALLTTHAPWAPLLPALLTACVYLSLRRTVQLAEERQVAEARLAHQTLHDPLTDLPNRTLFRTRLAQALARHSVAVLFLDLDRLKVINDSLGHAAGDRVLVAVARRLRAVLRPGDTAARFGGDEFTILLEGPAGARDATATAERLAAEIRAPIALDGRDLVVTASVGIAPGGVGANPDELLRHADIALYRAKLAGGAARVVFDPGMTAPATQRLILELDLRRALEREEFVVHYQPQVAPATGRIAGLEALVRWQHPRRGLVLPTEFIPLAEETGLILPLGEWVLATACRQAARWRERCPDDPPPLLSVNLSARQFQHPDLPRAVARILRESGLAPCGLALELTESLLMEDVDATIATLRALQALGVRLAIDDFGTGYSSLRYLQRFPVDTLKIDRLFVARLGRGPRDLGIVEAVTRLGHTLDLRVVAEGVESAAQLCQLRALGCDLVQGEYFAPPLPAAAAEALLCGGAVLGGDAPSGLPALATRPAAP